MTTTLPSLAKLKPNTAYALLPLFDRSGCKRVRFGDVVENCAETCDPAEAGLERFVAMEHLEPGSLHVRSWGNVADGTTFTRRCRPGQVLFGKRRAYQRKVAVAEFEAVVSGDIYVLAPKDTRRLLPELLPFLCLSERFFQHAVGTSAGSLSPRTNWSSLASFEFDLPPLDQQRRIAEMLWAVDEAILSYTAVAQDSESLKCAAFDSALRGSAKPNPNGTLSSSWPVRPVGDLCERISVGIVVNPSKYYAPTGVRCFRSANVRRGFIEDKDWIFISEEAHRMHSKSMLREADVLVVRSGVFAGMACVVSPEYDSVNCIDIVFATPKKDVLVSDWLCEFINSAFGQVEIKRGERGLAQKHFGVDAMRNLPLPVPPIEEQKRQLEVIRTATSATVNAQQHCQELRTLLTAIIQSCCA